MWRNDSSKFHQLIKHLSNTKSMIFSIQRHNKRQYQLSANSLQSSYAQLYHTAVPQAMSRNNNFPHHVSDDTTEYYYKQSDKSDVVASCHIPDETEQSGTHFLFTENIFTKWLIAVHCLTLYWTIQKTALFKQSSRTPNNKLTGTFTNYRTTTDVMTVRLSGTNAKWRDIVYKHGTMWVQHVRQSVFSSTLRYV